MSTDDLQPIPQEAVSSSPLRKKLLHEIDNIPADLAEAEEVECVKVHPFRDLNVTSFVRQVDALFLHRWLEGYDSSKNAQVQTAWDNSGAIRTAKHL